MRLDVVSFLQRTFPLSSMKMQCLIFQASGKRVAWFFFRVFSQSKLISTRFLCVLSLKSQGLKKNSRGSTATIWSWSTGCVRGDAWKTKHAITVIGTPHITEDTRQEICRILAWDFKQLEQGVYDFVGHTGSFHPLKSSREKLAGESMPVKAVTLPEFRF